MSMNIFTPHMIVVDPATTANAVNIDQIDSVAYDAQTQMALRAATVDTAFAAVLAQAHRWSVGASALATILAEASGQILTDAMKIDADGEHPGADIWYKQRQNLGTFASGSAHTKCTIASGLIVPRTLGVSQSAMASLVLDLLAIWDETNDPVVVAVDQALSGTPAADEFFTLGPVYLDTTEIEDVQGWNLTSGIAEQLRFGGGRTWPTHVSLRARGPSLTCNVLDVELLSSLGIVGDGKEVTLFLRKLENKAKTYADNTENHIKLTIAEAHVGIGTIPAQFGGDAEPGVVITPVHDGSNDIIQVTTGTTITAPT